MDPCCGSGGMFVQSVKFVQAHSGNRNSISVYGQESNADTWKMAKMNMAIRGIEANFGPYQADTFFNDLHKGLKFDFIMANPPFNHKNWGAEKLADDVHIPRSLREVGVQEKDLDFLAASAMADACTPGNPRDVTKEEIIAIYKSIY